MHSKHILNLLAASIWPVSAVLASNLPRDVSVAGNGTSTSYDYIVVGSGPGGGPLASRLAIAGFKVLLIEAGSDQGNTLQASVPTLWPLSAEYAPMQWDYFTWHFPNETVQETDTKFTWQTPSGDYYVGQDPPADSTPLGILYPRAGTLGGCASHNALITILPHDEDFTYIQTLTGDSSWAPRKMKKYFERLERNEYLPGDKNGHGYNGWLGTSVLDPSITLKDRRVTALIAAANAAAKNKAIGTPPKTTSSLAKIQLLDINAPGQNDNEGIYQLPLAVSNGSRSGPRNFIVDTATERNSNGTNKYSLDVWLNTYVTKIQFSNDSTPKAIGVDYITGTGLYGATPNITRGPETGSGFVYATREIIISAGAYNSPQLLKLSGIGPKAELESFNIPVIVDSPGVGNNLQDRYETAVVSKTPDQFEILNGCSLLNVNPDECLVQWENGTTPVEKGFYTGNAFPVGVVRKSSVAASSPDLFIFGGPVSFAGFYPGWTQLQNLIPDAATTGWWSWVVLKAHNRNTAGTVTLRSTNPFDTPIIEFKTFEYGTTANNSNVLDLQAFYEGVEFARNAMSHVSPVVNTFTEVFPGPDIKTETDVKNFIKKEAFGHHASCSCAIGADGDPNAVLDSNFKVRGVNGLRVVDASSWPKNPGFFPALPTYIISEKASDAVIADAKTWGV